MKLQNTFSKNYFCSAVVALLGIGSITAAQANLVTDGDFEIPDVSSQPSQIETFTNGQTLDSVWTVGGTSVDVVGNYWVAASGTQSVDLSGTDAGSLSQTLTTVAGQTYTISFAFSGNPDNGPTVKTMDLYFGGVLISSPTFDTTGISRSDMGWETLTFNATATSTSTVLEFDSTTAGSWGPVIDSVDVTAVPEPSEYGVFLFLAVAGVIAVRRFKTAAV